MGLFSGIPIVGDIESAGEDVLTSIAHDAGLDFIPDAVSSLFNDFKDFFSKEPGLTIARALAGGLYMELVPIVGPAFASVSFATPGLLRGEKFDEAWVKEFLWRLKTLLYLGSKVFTGGQADKAVDLIPDNPFTKRLPTKAQVEDLLKQMDGVASWLKAIYPGGCQSIPKDAITLTMLARAYGARTDWFVQAVKLYCRNDQDMNFCYNAKTGDVITCPTKESK